MKKSFDFSWHDLFFILLIAAIMLGWLLIVTGCEKRVEKPLVKTCHCAGVNFSFTKPFHGDGITLRFQRNSEKDGVEMRFVTNGCTNSRTYIDFIKNGNLKRFRTITVKNCGANESVLWVSEIGFIEIIKGLNAIRVVGIYDTYEVKLDSLQQRELFEACYQLINIF